jgi:hypothetical protein
MVTPSGANFGLLGLKRMEENWKTATSWAVPLPDVSPGRLTQRTESLETRRVFQGFVPFSIYSSRHAQTRGEPLRTGGVGCQRHLGECGQREQAWFPGSVAARWLKPSGWIDEHHGVNYWGRPRIPKKQNRPLTFLAHRPVACGNKGKSG